MSDKVLAYFEGDNLASSVWSDKYCLKDTKGNAVEETPTDMHWRLAKEFARIEFGYINSEITENVTKLKDISNLSIFGYKLINKRVTQTLRDIEQEFFDYFDKFGQIVPQGSIMSNLGNFFVYGSLSNCFGIEDPYDSYGGIMKFDQVLAQLMKRRGGVGGNLDTIRPKGTTVSNASKTSTGVIPYAERFSNTTREVAQEGRRGALMLLLHVNHPQIFDFVQMKDDRTKVTGANVSVKFTDEFMNALEKGDDFICRFPVDYPLTGQEDFTIIKYNVLVKLHDVSVMRIKPQELFDLVAEMAWKNAEPGVAFYDRVVDYSPEGVYERYRARVCNPCGEQWFAFLETCRLIALNFWSIVVKHFEEDVFLDLDLLYELAYMQQRLGDNLVDLECEYIDRIIAKIDSDPEPEDIKEVEKELWLSIKDMAEEGRRTGGGFTALGDMLAALGMKYDSPEALATVEMVMKTKMRAELDCTIDMAILRGTFEGWDRTKEFRMKSTHLMQPEYGLNSFFDMLLQEFPEQAIRMYQYGRRNTNWSTVAPTGTVSLMTQSTSGLEPLFKAYYIRRKKINPSEEGARVDFVDQSGDKWQEYAVLHPKFKEWIKNNAIKYIDLIGEDLQAIEELSKDHIQLLFEKSPWYKSEADDIAWEKRIEMQSIIQRYTSNAISSTINLPKDVPLTTVKGIYLAAYHAGLKGVTVYRDGSRSGVLITEPTKSAIDKFGYTDAIKRPKELEAHYHTVYVRGKLFAVVIGLLDGVPYELFATEEPVIEGEIHGKIIKEKQGIYKFVSTQLTIENLQLTSAHTDEKLLTRMCSQLLRHGVNPKHIVEQVDKSEVTVVSFAKAIVRVLKRYIPNEVTGQVCKVCEQPTVIYEEGCRRCTNCGDSKC